MLELLSVIVFAVALSLDGFGVGISYGVRKIKIPLLSLLVISATSGVAIGVSMLCGHLVARFISIQLAEIVGALILISVGVWILVQTWTQNKKEQPKGSCLQPEGEQAECKEILNFKIKAFGLVIQILREPVVADFDKSGNISVKEAVLLGLALAMDALGAGFGAAMTGFRPLLTPLVVSIVKFIMVSGGIYLGRRYAAKWLGDKASVIPGWVLILLGVLRVIKI
ncbi:MAG TPA: sporulation membrane protein YtaF [Desulfobacteria bacterium]|nr:sporulation membrane protein YtaF [Desulfobacteria bacterium]